MLATISGEQKAFNEARRLEQDEQHQAAFSKSLEVPGCEFAAATIARPQAREFLTLLRERSAATPEVCRRLLEAGLLLALRDQSEALAADIGRNVGWNIEVQIESGVNREAKNEI